LVKNDDHVEFAKRLFNFFINDFKNDKEIQFERKSPEYLECYTSAVKLLKKIKRLEKTIHIQKEMIHQFVQKLAPQKFKKHQED
jgi:hypothetical protein